MSRNLPDFLSSFSYKVGKDRVQLLMEIVRRARTLLNRTVWALYRPTCCKEGNKMHAWRRQYINHVTVDVSAESTKLRFQPFWSVLLHFKEWARRGHWCDFQKNRVVYRKFMVRVTNSIFRIVISMAKENPSLPKSIKKWNFYPWGVWHNCVGCWEHISY